MSVEISIRLGRIVSSLIEGLNLHAPRLKMPIALHRHISGRLWRLHARLRHLIARGPIAPRPPRATPRATPCATAENAGKPAQNLECDRFSMPQLCGRLKRESPSKSSMDFYPPSHFGWLSRLLHHTQAPAARSWLSHLLDEPETQALITAHPTLARSIRPLCHMLGLKPPACLHHTPRPRAKRPPSATSATASAPASAPASATNAQKPKPPRNIWRPYVPTPATPAQQRLMLAQMLSTRQILS